MKNRGYLHVFSLVLLVWTGITYITEPWMWIALTFLAGIYPIRPYTFGRYFTAAIIAQGLHFFISIQDMAHVEAVSRLLGLSGVMYASMVMVISAAVFAVLATTVQSFSQLLDPKRIP